jgi:predicted DNA-binding transcriptional regulator AlpA
MTIQQAVTALKQMGREYVNRDLLKNHIKTGKLNANVARVHYDIDIREALQLYPAMEPEYIRITDVAKELGLTRQRVWQIVKEKNIPLHTKPPLKRIVFIHKNDVSKIR